jgi:hypothetical protein
VVVHVERDVWREDGFIPAAISLDCVDAVLAVDDRPDCELFAIRRTERNGVDVQLGGRTDWIL